MTEMSDFMYCVLTYTYAAIVFLLLQVLVHHQFKGKLDVRRYLIACSVLWVGFIFNVTYTGIMGWNRKPASELELLLDNISSSIIVLSTVMILTGFAKRRKKESGTNAKRPTS